MGEEEPPPAHEREVFDSSASSELAHQDWDGIILESDRLEEGVIGYANPTTLQERAIGWPRPYLVRTMRIDELGRTYSTIDLATAHSPTKIDKPHKVLLEGNGKSYEDPRITKLDNTFFITFIGYNGKNAVPELVTTDNFENINHCGRIGPNVPLEEAIKIVKDDDYKEEFAKTLESLLESDNLEEKPLIYTKDAVLDHINGEYVLFLRVGRHLQTAKAEKWKYFQEKEYWKEWLSEINRHEALRARDNQVKIGWGSPLAEINGDKVLTYHEVYRPREGILVYVGNFAIFNPETMKIEYALRDPLLKPSDEYHIYREKDPKTGETLVKEVYFPTVIYQDASSPETVWTHSGVGDAKILARSVGKNWLLAQLNHSANRINWDDIAA